MKKGFLKNALCAFILAFLLTTPSQAADDLGPITKFDLAPEGALVIAYGGLKSVVTHADYRLFGHEDEPDPCENPDAAIDPEMIECRIKFEKPVASGDRKTLAWLVAPIDIVFKYGGGAQLVIYKEGAIVDILGGGPAIRDFKFVDRGTQIAIAEAPVVGEVTKYVLYDIVAHQRLAEFASADANGVLWPKNQLPAWARSLLIWGTR